MQVDAAAAVVLPRRFSRLPTDKLSTTSTSSPRATRASTRWLPMNPAPPVTSTRRGVTGFLLDLAQDAGRISGHDRAGRHVTRHHAAGADDRVLADLDPQRIVDPDPIVAPFRTTVGTIVQSPSPDELAGGRDGARKPVVDEGHAVADEDMILDQDALADERVTLRS